MKAPTQLLRADGLLGWARQIVACLAKGLTLADNHRGDVVSTQVRDTALPIDVRTSLTTVPGEVRVMSLAERGGNETRTSGNKVTWSYRNTGADGSVRISAIDGLSAGVTYDAVLWIGAG
jgi:hypothetical protein